VMWEQDEKDGKLREGDRGQAEMRNDNTDATRRTLPPDSKITRSEKPKT